MHCVVDCPNVLRIFTQPHGSEGQPIHSSVNTHKHTHSGVIHLCTRDYMAVHKCWGVYLSVCVVGSHVCLHVTDNYPLCDFASHSGKTQQTLLIDSSYTAAT